MGVLNSSGGLGGGGANQTLGVFHSKLWGDAEATELVNPFYGIQGPWEFVTPTQGPTTKRWSP